MSENPKTDSAQAPADGFAIPEFDEHMALEAIDEILALPAENENGPCPGHVVTPQLQSKLDCQMPLEAYAIGAQSGHAYVPGFLIDYIARGLFRDMWDTEVVNAQILHQGTRMMVSQDPAHRAPQKVFQVVAMATVRVTLRGENGTSQTHTEVGTGSYQVPADDPSIEDPYKIAIKGAARDARQRALGLFGRVFNVRGQNQDELLDRLQQRRSIDAEVGAAPTQNPFSSQDKPAGTVLTLRDTIHDATLPVINERAFIDAYVAAIETASTIEEMEGFVKANAETLKNLKSIGDGDFESRISNAIDRQYVGLSQFREATDKKECAAPQSDTETRTDEKTEAETETKADDKACEPAVTENTETAVEDASNATPASAEEARDETDETVSAEDAGDTPSAPIIPFTLGENGKIRKAKTYVKAFLAAIEAAKSREELNLLMDANQENLKRLPRSEIRAINAIAQARAKKSGEFVA